MELRVSRKRLTLYTSIFLLGIATFFSVLAWRVTGSDDTNKSMLSNIESCLQEENAVMCSRPLIQKMLESRTGAEVMAEISGVLSPQECHYIGHVVGQQSYVKYEDLESAIGQCDRECDSACVHGAIGEALIEGLGLGRPEEIVDVDFQHLSGEEIQSIGKKLCSSPQTCHGVGHALFQVYKDFEPALDTCAEFGEENNRRSYCAQAVFMEYADIISSRNMRNAESVEYPTLESVSRMCDEIRPSDRRSCFRYFPRVYILVHELSGYTTREARAMLGEHCQSYARVEDRIGCMTGIGVYSSYSIVTDKERAVRTCLAFPELLDQAACNFGLISVASQDRQKETLAFCAAIPHRDLRGDCFKQVFYFFNRLGTDPKTAAPLCNGDEQCLEGSRKYLIEPSEMIRQYMHK